MTEEFEDLIRGRLRAETDALHPDAALLANVRRGSRRRTMRDGVVAIAAIGALAVGGWPLIDHARHDDTAAPPSAAHTVGDLAHDTDYLNQVKVLVTNWERHYTSLSGSHVMSTVFRGRPDPQIVWAGTTAAGKAAVVSARPRATYGDGHWRTITTYAFVAPGRTGKPTLVQPFADKGNVPDQASGAFIGADRRTLLAVDVPETRYVSLRANRDAAGVSHRTYTRLHFTGPVRVLTMPAGVDQNDVVMLPAPDDTKHRAYLANAPAERSQPQQLLDWMARPWQIGKPDGFWKKDRIEQQLTSLSKAETALDGTDDGSQGMQWYAYGTTPNGEHVIVTDIQGDRTEAHVVATIYPPTGHWRTVVDGPADTGSALPVRVRLPDGNGWVVAARGATLSYRIGSGTWQQPRQNAALCPANATAVRVVNRGTTAVVPLS